MRAAFALAVVSLACRSGTTGRPLDLPLCAGSGIVPPEARAPTIPLDPIRAEVDAGEWCRSDGWCWWNFPRGTGVTAVWGSGASDVWATTDSGAMLHFDGERWSATAFERHLLSVWGVDAGEAYAVGREGKTLRWDGVSWSDLPGGDAPWAGPPASPPMNVSASGRIAFAPHRGGLARFDGERWSEIPGPGEPTGLWMLWAWAAGSDEAFAVALQPEPGDSPSFVLRLRGGRWDVHRSEIRAETVNASSPSNVWASRTDRVLGELPYAQTTLERFDGVSWRAAPETAVGPHGGAFFPAPGDMWLGDFRLEGGCWKQHAGPVGRLLWASGSDDIWGTQGSSPGAGDGELARWDGTRWSTRVRLRGDLRLLGEAGPSDAWALALVDDGWVLVAWDGTTWAAVPGSLVARHRGEIRGRSFGTSARDVWVARATGDAPPYERALLHWDGGAWTRHVLGVKTVLGWGPLLAGSGSRDVWAWGDAATFHWDGERWTELPSPGDVVALWVPAPGTVFALGVRRLPDGRANDVQDVIWRWNGAGWTEDLAGAVRALGRTGSVGGGEMWGAAPDDGWAALNALYRWDGTSWTRFEGAPISSPSCMWGTATDDVWVISRGAGGEGTWRWDGTAWARAPAAPGCGTGRWLAGGWGSLWRRSGADGR